jgi:hypothetical protein
MRITDTFSGCRLVCVSHGDGGVVVGGGRTAGTALAPGSLDIPGSLGCSGVGGAATRVRGAAGGCGMGQSRNSSPIVPQREQNSSMGVRQSPRKCPGTPHLQHKDSGRGSHPLLVLHSVADFLGRVFDIGSVRGWSLGPGGVVGCIAAAGGGSPGLFVGTPGWGVPGGGCSIGMTGRGTDGWAVGLGSGLSTPARAASISSTTVQEVVHGVDSVWRRRYLRIDECSRAVGLGVSLWRGRGGPADVFPGLNGTHLVKSGGGGSVTAHWSGVWRSDN